MGGFTDGRYHPMQTGATITLVSIRPDAAPADQAVGAAQHITLVADERAAVPVVLREEEGRAFCPIEHVKRSSIAEATGVQGRVVLARTVGAQRPPPPGSPTFVTSGSVSRSGRSRWAR